jgi:hypothetical protein
MDKQLTGTEVLINVPFKYDHKKENTLNENET